jgi:hypothetical protein
MAILRQQRLDIYILHVAKLRGEGVDGDHLDRAGTFHFKAFAVNNGQPRSSSSLGFLCRFLRGLHMIENPRIIEPHVRILPERFLGSRDTVLQIGWALVACQYRDRSLFAHRLGKDKPSKTSDRPSWRPPWQLSGRLFSWGVCRSL